MAVTTERQSMGGGLDPFAAYKATWSKKTTIQVEREAASMRRYMARNSLAYAWHGANVPPGSLGDGDKLLALQEIIRERAA